MTEPSASRPLQHLEPAPELLCPLCDYDVRGLPEPRCPECGYGFEWGELTDPARKKLRWLFEHRRGLGGYLGTWLRLWWPWDFWGVWLRPSHRLVVRRVVGFGVVGVVMAVLVVGVGVVGTAVVRTQLYSLGARRLESIAVSGAEVRMLARLPNPPQNPTRADVNAMKMKMPTPMYLDSRYPLWSTPTVPQGVSFSHLAFNEGRRNLRQTWAWLGTAIALPLVGMLVLGVMRQSFSRAKIKVGHAVRVAVYSGDVSVFAMGYVAVCVLELLNTLGWVNLPYVFLQTGTLPWVGLGAGAVWLFRFEAGVRRYLCIPRPWLVTGATTLIAGLVMVILVSNAYSWRF